MLDSIDSVEATLRLCGSIEPGSLSAAHLNVLASAPAARAATSAAAASTLQRLRSNMASPSRVKADSVGLCQALGGQAVEETVAGGKLGERDELVGLMRLRDMARSAYDRGYPDALKIPGFGAKGDGFRGIAAREPQSQRLG